MDTRTLLLGFASAVTIEILSTWYGECPGVGILGVAVGIIVAFSVGAVVAFTGD